MDDELSQCVFWGISSRFAEIVPLDSMNVSIRIGWRLFVLRDVPKTADSLVCSTGDWPTMRFDLGRSTQTLKDQRALTQNVREVPFCAEFPFAFSREITDELRASTGFTFPEGNGVQLDTMAALVWVGQDEISSKGPRKCIWWLIGCDWAAQLIFCFGCN